MSAVDAGIQNGDDDIIGADGGVPRRRRPDLGQVPFQGIVGVIRDRRWWKERVRFGKFNVRIMVQRIHHQGPFLLGHFQETHVNRIQDPLLSGAVGGKEVLQSHLVHALCRLDQEPPGHDASGSALDHASPNDR